MEKRKTGIWSIIEKMILFLMILIFFIFCISTAKTLKSTNALAGSSFSVYDVIFINGIFSLVLELIVWIFYIVIAVKIKRNHQVTTIHKFLRLLKKNRGKAIIFSGIILVFLLFICIYYGQELLMFYPSYSYESNFYLEKRDCYEKISINGKDGEVYSGWLHRADKESRKTVIYYGGNAQSSAVVMRNYDIDEAWEMFLDYNFLMVDYPGYGESSGKPSNDSILKMAESVYDYVKTEQGLNEQIIIMGFSIGTGPATYVSSVCDVNGLVLVAPYDEARSLYNKYINIFHGPICFMVRNKFESKKYAKNVKVSPLIIASEDDEVIPYQLSQKLSKEFLQSPAFITVKKLGHNDILSNKKVRESIKEYLEQK